MNNQEIDALIADFFAVKQAILQLNFILSLIQAEIVRLSEEGNNEEEIDALIQDAFVVTQVILQLTSILVLIQAEIVRLSEENAA
ncbi:MAG: hypothetical protein GX236_03045 [Clostridiaceae bacterium]|jgi:hypothetical protein|nr:hypothetical protein [Clostridiaceae bacterium]